MSYICNKENTTMTWVIGDYKFYIIYLVFTNRKKYLDVKKPIET